MYLCSIQINMHPYFCFKFESVCAILCVRKRTLNHKILRIFLISDIQTRLIKSKHYETAY